MKSNTATIIALLAALLSCCLGLILSSFGVLALATPPPPGTAYSAPTFVYVAICLGLLLIAAAVILGVFAWRRNRARVAGQPPAGMVTTAEPARPASPTPVKPAVPNPPAHANPAPVPPSPAVSPLPGTPVTPDASMQAVRERIMALNRPSAPYQIVDGQSKGVDLIAEWKIVDAQWYEVFSKANLTKVFRIYMKFDPGRREVRAMDEELNVSWNNGLPSLSAERSFFRGQKSSISFGTGYAFTENLTPGQVYKYKFSTNELKKPIQDAITASGWSYRGVAFGKL